MIINWTKKIILFNLKVEAPNFKNHMIKQAKKNIKFKIKQTTMKFKIFLKESMTL